MKRMMLIGAIFAVAWTTACEPYEPLTCEPCEDSCGPGLSCEGGVCIAPGALCGLSCASFEDCHDGGETCIDGVCVIPCSPEQACSSATDRCVAGRCVGTCGDEDVQCVGIDPLGVERVGGPDVTLVIRTLSVAAVELSNVASLHADHPSTMRLDLRETSPTKVTVTRHPYNLDVGLPSCPDALENGCPRTVFARFLGPSDREIRQSEVTVLVDRRPPALAASPTFEIRPPAGAWVSEVSALTDQSVATLFVAVDEPLAPEGLEVIVDGEVDASWLISSDDQISFVLTATITDERPEGEHALELRATDLAGLRASIPIELSDPPFFVDRTAPAEVNVGRGGLVVLRSPWREPALSAEGPPGTIEGEATLVITDEDDREVGRTGASADGAIEAFVGAATDGPLFARAVDRAGNASPGSQVRNVRFTATLESSGDGPTVSITTNGRPSLWSLDRSAVSQDARSRMSEADGTTLVVSSPRAWGLASLAGAELARINHELVHEPRSGRMLAVGGQVMTAAGLTATTEVARLDDGAWTAVPVALSPSSASLSTLVVASPRHGGVLMFGRQDGTAWLFDGATWRDRSGSKGTAEALDAVTFDALRHEIIGIDGGRLYRWGDDGWEHAAWISSLFLDGGTLVHDSGRDLLVAIQRNGRTSTAPFATLEWTQRGTLPRGPSMRRPSVVYHEARSELYAIEQGDRGMVLYRLDGGTRWEEVVSPGPAPLPRNGAALAYDPVGRRLMLTGGIDSSGARILGETWVWDGRWQALTPVRPTPPARAAPSQPEYLGGLQLAYDGASGRSMLLTTGRVSTDPIWMWDGRRWFASDVSEPAALVGAVYHEGLDRLVAVSTNGTAYTWERDRWLWWRGGSHHFHGGSLVYDPLADEIVVHAGYASAPGALWALDEDGWRALAPRPAAMAPRGFVGLVRDVGTSRFLLVGGDVRGTSTLLTDLWRYESGQLTPVTGIFPGRLIEANPSAFVFDEHRRSPSVFAGTDEVWWYTGSTPGWTLARLYYQEPEQPDRGYVAAYDTHRDEMILFGGIDRLSGRETAHMSRRRGGTTYMSAVNALLTADLSAPHTLVQESNERLLMIAASGVMTSDRRATLETWSFSGNNFSDETTFAFHMDDQPAPLGSRIVAAHHAARSVTVVFNGESGQRTLASNGGLWVESEPSEVTPPPRRGHTMVYDAERSEIILFGGRAPDGAPLSDTWAWDGAWSLRTPSDAPTARFDHAAAWDSDRRRVVLFGGRSAFGRPLADTWEWDGATWVARPASGPVARFDHGLTYDATAKQVMLVGGVDAGDVVLADAWAWDGTQWHRPALDGEIPFARTDGRAAFRADPRSGQLVLTSNEEAWVAPPADTNNAGVLMTWQFGDVVDDVESLLELQVDVVAGGRGFQGADEAPGVEILLFDFGARRFRPIAGNDAGEPSVLTARADAAEGDYIDDSGDAFVWLRTRGASGGGTSPPTLEVDDVTVSLVYRSRPNR